VIFVAVMPGAEAVGVEFWLVLLVVVVVLAAVPQAAVTTAKAASTATTDEVVLVLNDVFNVSPLPECARSRASLCRVSQDRRQRWRSGVALSRFELQRPLAHAVDDTLLTI
jgi:hypothetical protein